MTDRRSLFLRLMPKPGRKGSPDRIEGQEAWLTQALGHVLETDQALARKLVEAWFVADLPRDVTVEVATEVAFVVPAQDKTAVIDLVLRVPGHVRDRVEAVVGTLAPQKKSETANIPLSRLEPGPIEPLLDVMAGLLTNP